MNIYMLYIDIYTYIYRVIYIYIYICIHIIHSHTVCTVPKHVFMLYLKECINGTYE